MALELRPGAFEDAGGAIVYPQAFVLCDEDPDG